MTGRAAHRQERCVPMAAGSAEIASEQRTPRRSLGEQRHYGAAGIARRREPGLSFAQGARMSRTYGKCRIDLDWQGGSEAALAAIFDSGLE